MEGTNADEITGEPGLFEVRLVAELEAESEQPVIELVEGIQNLIESSFTGGRIAFEANRIEYVRPEPDDEPTYQA